MHQVVPVNHRDAHGLLAGRVQLRVKHDLQLRKLRHVLRLPLQRPLALALLAATVAVAVAVARRGGRS